MKAMRGTHRTPKELRSKSPKALFHFAKALECARVPASLSGQYHPANSQNLVHSIPDIRRDLERRIAHAHELPIPRLA
jgi:hypothetical protein